MARSSVVLVLALTLAGCGGGGGIKEPDVAESIAVTSTAFDGGGRIPAQFTCRGDGASPPLSWSGVPEDATSTVLEVQDPDAPGDTFVHWLVVDMPPRDATLASGASPPGSERDNSAGKTGWTPPCPPSGTHHYHFTVYALDVSLGSDADVEAVARAVDTHLVAWGELVGTVTASGGDSGGGY
jgi:Raf kinase inhibitor-like YbhB/YbcL family protein